MFYIKELKLQNFCGYQSFHYKFGGEGSIKKWSMLYGPNGTFKTTFLNAVSLLSCPNALIGKYDPTTLLHKLTYSPNYLPGVGGGGGECGLNGDEANPFFKDMNVMIAEALFCTDDGEYTVQITNNGIKEESGITINELPQGLRECTYFIDADHPNNLNGFRLRAEYADEFCDFCKEIYNLDCYLPKESLVGDLVDMETEETIDYYGDFVIIKRNDYKVHYKSMSAGEQKLATMVSLMFNYVYGDGDKKDSILLIDNIELHVYFKRHMDVIKMMDKYFPANQILATTHSPALIDGMKPEYLIDMEDFISSWGKK